MQGGQTSKQPTMPLGDESRLTWYFGIGQTAFERSTTGAMLERAEVFAWCEKRCRKCDHGALADGSECGACKGTGYIGAKSSGSKASGTGYRRCPGCRGLGTNRQGDTCQQCDGDLYISEDVNAFASPSKDDATGYTPDDYQLAIYARVSRRLARLPASIHADVLQAYYGDLGARWGRTRHGRLFAVYHLTPKGSRWASDSRRESEKTRNSADLTPSEIIGVQAELEKTQPKRERRAALDACDRQARELFAAAVQAWVETLKPEPVADWEVQWLQFRAALAERRAKQCLAA